MTLRAPIHAECLRFLKALDSRKAFQTGIRLASARWAVGPEILSKVMFGVASIKASPVRKISPFLPSRWLLRRWRRLREPRLLRLASVQLAAAWHAVRLDYLGLRPTSKTWLAISVALLAVMQDRRFPAAV